MPYEVFDPRVDRPLHELPREGAVKAYERFIESIPERMTQIANLVSDDGLSLDFSEASLAQLNDWFYEVALEEAELGNDAPSPELFSVCNDVAVYIAEMIRRAKKGVHWTLYVSNETDVSYQRPVLVGFRTAAKDYHVDLDYLLCQYAFRILSRRKQEKEIFRSMYRRAIALA